MCLEEKLQTLKQLDAEIVELVADGEFEDEIAGANGYKENIFAALTRIECTLHPPAVTAPLPTVGMPVMSPVTPHVSNRVKPPKLALPRFEGSILKWPTFWDSFESAVHKNRDLSDVDKFNYLVIT